MPIQRGDELALTIDNVAHGGVFVGRHEGRVLFVPDTLPGETVRVRVTDLKKSFGRGETLEVLEASPDRVPHVWPEASIERAPERRAGGAELGHVRLAAQRALKQRVVEDALRRTGRIERDVTVQAAPGDAARGGLGWRTRVTLHVDEQGRQGPFAARSHTVVPVETLPLATEAIQEQAQLDMRLPGATSVDYVQRTDGSVDVIATEGDPVRGRTDTILERVGDRELRVDRAGFWQVHREAPGVLVDAVRRAIDVTRIDPKAANLDLYGGVGLLATALGDVLGPQARMMSVESDEVATDHASENLAEWLGALAITAKVDRFLRDALQDASAAERDRLRAATVVLDPPRAGAGGETIASLVELAPQQIVYVACDPVAFARDARLLVDGGYDLGPLEAFDLFPHTHHVECVARFTRG
ncbi:class I SAM-dependent RNA methyltransferase [Agrococcus jejuensis]|uniref:class I SAM-dependent RNA methyltransferase n=1 Tax=Agrococcus jejuensis TaxID=399736 RepID=UPI001642705E|nr:TRAM domain-containing protein [Agrococcus jejuensis]